MTSHSARPSTRLGVVVLASLLFCRSPRPLLRGRSRRRQRQWHALNAGSPGAVFPSVINRPEKPCIMAGMDQKDCCSGLFKAGVVGYDALRAVFPSLVYRPQVLGILAGMDQQSCTSRVSVFSAQLGSTVDTCTASVYGTF